MKLNTYDNLRSIGNKEKSEHKVREKKEKKKRRSRFHYFQTSGLDQNCFKHILENKPTEFQAKQEDLPHLDHLLHSVSYV